MSWESPIQVIYDRVRYQFEEDVCRAVQKYDIKVDKEELIKALEYDRGQYDKGYADGKLDADSDLIYCKDCAFWSERFTITDKDKKPIRRHCLNFGIMTDKDFYCGWGCKDET